MPVIIFDEIGLAEQSPHNPLKILHSLLENIKVGFVGISNWSLDASKMNRVLTLSKLNQDVDDLRQSGESISLEINYDQMEKHSLFVNQHLSKLAKQYHSYYKSQKQKNFHGLRDYYSLIKQICFTLTLD